MKLYNTLGRELQSFTPKNSVKIYTCGPTVYDFQHIGNYSGYIYWDALVRLLKFQGHQVKRVMNITDVGHLVSDADEGEDKLDKGAKREGKTAKQVADFYTNDFLASMEKLALVKPVYARATEYVPQQIEMIQTLVDKGYAYQSPQAIYFDISKLSDYGKLTGQELADKEIGARDEVVTDKSKRNPQDFALWFFATGRFASHQLKWVSPWGEGFPGWHIECSAIVHSLLGEPIDIHAGGIDHIGTHHTNEIAQTEAAFDKQLSKFWLHNNHLMVDAQKISKSKNNGFTLEDLATKGYSAMDFKMLVLQSHYRSQSNFTWEALQAAKNRLTGWANAASLRHQKPLASEHQSVESLQKSIKELATALEDDLNTAAALTVVDGIINKLENNGLAESCRSEFSEWLEAIHELLGIDLAGLSPDIAPKHKELINEREAARLNQDWAKSDALRQKLEQDGIGLKDTANGATWYRLAEATSS